MSSTLASGAWPPSSGLTTKVVPRKDAVFQIYHSNTINAPAAHVFDGVLRIADYNKWNTWVPNAQILKQPPCQDASVESNDPSRIRNGTMMNFDVIMDASKPSKTAATGLQVTDISTPDRPSDYVDSELRQDPSFTADLSKVYRVSWTTHGGFVSRGLRSERFHEIIVISDNECEVRTWEVMCGMLAYTVKWMYQSTLQDTFKLWCNDLKRYSEQTRANEP